MGRPEEFPVQGADLFDGEVARPLEPLIDRRHVADVAARIGGEGALESVEGQTHRLGTALLDRGQVLPLEDLELVLGERGLAEDLAEDLQDGGKIGALGLESEGDTAGPRASGEPHHPAAHPATEPGEVLVEGVLELLARHRLRAPGHQLGQHPGGFDESLEVLGIAEPQREPHLDRAAPTLLG